MITSTIKTITSVLCTWVWYLIGMLPIINCIVVVWWLFNRRERDISLERHCILAGAIYISAFFTFWVVLGIGILRWLFIISSSWDSYGEWSSSLSSLAGMLSFAGAAIVAYIFYEYERLTYKIERLEEENNKKDEQNNN